MKISNKYLTKHQPLQIWNCANFMKDEYLVRIDVKPLEKLLWWGCNKKVVWIRKNRRIYSNHFGIQVSLILHKCDFCYKWFVQEWMSTLFLGKPAGFMWSSTDSFFISLELCCNFAISFWNSKKKIRFDSSHFINFHKNLQVSLGQHHILIINQRKLCHHSSSQYVKA